MKFAGFGRRPATATPLAPVAAGEERPPLLTLGPLGWLRTNLFSSWGNALVTLLLLGLLLQVIPPLVQWLFINSIGFSGTAEQCRNAAGACWPFIGEKYRLILFGLYPYDQQWRPLAAMLAVLAVILASCDRRCWKPWLGFVWLGGLVVAGTLMWGGVLGLSPVDNYNWGGLPLTLFLSVVGLAVAFPLSVALALARRSDLPVIRTLSVTYIEIVRGVPLVSLLFMASVMLPLFLPDGVTIDKLLRAQIAIIIFASAYLAEVVRGGLQAIPRGQYEAADALGLTYWQKMIKIILPQALALVIPPIVNTFIAFFKDTSLVVIIGLYDLMGSAKAALADGEWRGFFVEGYLFIGIIYWLFCFSMSKYSRWLEKSLTRGHHH